MSISLRILRISIFNFQFSYLTELWFERNGTQHIYFYYFCVFFLIYLCVHMLKKIKRSQQLDETSCSRNYLYISSLFRSAFSFYPEKKNRFFRSLFNFVTIWNAGKNWMTTEICFFFVRNRGCWKSRGMFVCTSIWNAIYIDEWFASMYVVAKSNIWS